MTLRAIGAGVGRTGTLSLKLAFERLLGAPCYHMLEVFRHPEHVPHWAAAVRGEPPDWRDLLAGYAAAVDWPVAAFWPELMEAFPDAVVVLSQREARSWWESANATILPVMRGEPPRDPPFMRDWHAAVVELLRSRFCESLDDAERSMAAFRRHNERVRAQVPPERLVEWTPGDGWVPLCAALGLPVPDEPFPHRNTREEYRARLAAARRAQP